MRKAPAVRKVPVQKPAKKRPAPFGKKEDKHRWDQGMGGEPDGGQVYGVVWMSGVGERRELSKFENFETHVLDLGLNGRGVDVYGLLWGY